MIERAKRSLGDYLDILQDYPRQVHTLLEEARSGELKVKFVHVGLDDLTHKFDLLTNRIVIALIVAALAVASALMAAFISEGPQLLGVSVWGHPGFRGRPSVRHLADVGDRAFGQAVTAFER